MADNEPVDPDPLFVEVGTGDRVGITIGETVEIDVAAVALYGAILSESGKGFLERIGGEHFLVEEVGFVFGVEIFYIALAAGG